MTLSADTPADRRSAFRPDERHNRAVQQLENHVQMLVRESEDVRERSFLYKVMPELAERRWSTERRHPIHSVEKFAEGTRAFREQFYTEAMGRFDEPLLPPNARTRQVLDTEKWTAYDVVLDVFPDVFAWGVLVVPKDLRPGERRPVVVCQHGRNGLPRDTIDARLVRLQRLRRPAGGARLHHLRTAQSVPRRRPLPLAQPQGEHGQGDAVLVHHCPARPDPALARDAAVRRWRADGVLRPELRRRDGGARAAHSGEVLPFHLLGRLQSVDAEGRRDGPALQLHADDRVGDALLEPRAARSTTPRWPT